MGKLTELLKHPDEFLPMVKMLYAKHNAMKLPKDPDLAFCFQILNEVSRSFAVVINQLPGGLRESICLFYLVLRALDTIEDDMSIPSDKKLSMLRGFHTQVKDPVLSLDYGTGAYQILLKEFVKVNRVLMALKANDLEVILDITKRMGEGMAEFIEREVVTTEDFDKYCFYVAGLVGIGLSRLFSESKFETVKLKEMENAANEMGLLLQKTNILRDYLEDIMEEPAPRMFWPRAVWRLYAEKLEDFKDLKNRSNALKCLNHLLVDTLNHIPACLKYLETLKTTSIFRFCAIPQIMAIGTIAECLDNGKLFEGVVKLRRGLTCKIFDSTDSIGDVYFWFDHFLQKISNKLEGATIETPLGQKGEDHIKEYRKICQDGLKRNPAKKSSHTFYYLLIIIFLVGLLSGILFSSKIAAP